MKLPDFLIVGGMKCASSSLRNALMRHPNITMLAAEGNFYNIEENYSKGVSFYRDQFLAKDPEEKTFWAEKTVEYSLFPSIAQRIHETNPQVKLIWILRNPVDRTYSNYLHEYKRGEDTLTFEEALERENSGEVRHEYHKYLGRSMYSSQIENYLRYFDRDQIHFILFEDLTKGDPKVFSELGHFLKMDLSSIEYAPANLTILPRFPRLVHFANTRLKRLPLLRKVIAVINDRNRKSGYEPMKEVTRKELQLSFEGEVIALESLLNTNLDKWKE